MKKIIKVKKLSYHRRKSCWRSCATPHHNTYALLFFHFSFAALAARDSAPSGPVLHVELLGGLGSPPEGHRADVLFGI